MCGINGIINWGKTDQHRRSISAMNTALAHRGPDDDGVYYDKNVLLGHRRLSIIDLSKDGHQPFYSSDRRYVLVYNGELYNYKELKQELLDQYNFKTNTDTEVILASFIKWGRACLDKFNGMYAFAVWDTVDEILFVARDRLGIKPVYYWERESVLVFSSELRSLLASGMVPRKLNKDALSDYIQYQTVHAPDTIVKGVKMLMPGHFMVYKKVATEVIKYWDPVNKFDKDISKRTRLEIQNDIQLLLYRSVERRMLADVPFGAFLSGGIDSSIVVGLMSRVSSVPVKTFSVGFKENKFNESEYSSAVAKKFKTHHTPIELTAPDFMNELPNALDAMDHPGGDGPNTFVVSKVTKGAGVSMALSGLGGDELFGGYSIFKQSLAINKMHQLNLLPLALRKGVAALLRKIKSDISSEKIAEILSLKHISVDTTYPVYRKSLIDKQLMQLFFHQQISTKRVEEIVQNSFRDLPTEFPVMSKITLAETYTYLQNVLLRDTDQMSMANALEVRVPFLDYTLFEYMLSVPDHIKSGDSPKQLLVDSFSDMLPKEVFNRQKMGFVLPWQFWLKNELHELCVTHIELVEDMKLFAPGSVKALWEKFKKNDPSVAWSRVWHIIVLGYWMKKNSIDA